MRDKKSNRQDNSGISRRITYLGFVLLFVVVILVSEKYLFPKKQLPRQNELVGAIEDTFLQKNNTQIAEIEASAQKLTELISTLGVTGREFNQQMEPLIKLLAESSEQDLVENWQKFQSDFAYHYNKLNEVHQSQQNLPKEVTDAQEKIMEILQELNHSIQSMHK